MARVSRPADEILDDPSQALAQPEGTPTAQAAPAQAPDPAPRSRFNDLSRLLYANQGQGAKMAQGAISKADQAAADVNSRLAGAQSQYAKAASAATPKAIATSATPPLVTSGTGGLTGRGAPAQPALTGNMIQDLQMLQNRAPVTSDPRTTTQLNTTPDLAGAQAATTATYQGPHSLADTQGVDIMGLQQGLNQAGQEYSALGQNPSHQTGGAGRFNDFLIGAEAQPQIQAAQQRFAGLRDKFNAAIGDTLPGAAAEAAVANNAKAGRKVLDQNAADTAAIATKAMADQNAQAAAKADDDKAWAEWQRVSGPMGEAAGTGSRAYFDAHKDEIKKRLQDAEMRRFYGTTYGIGKDQLLAASGYNPDGTRKLG